MRARTSMQARTRTRLGGLSISIPPVAAEFGIEMTVAGTRFGAGASCDRTLPEAARVYY